MTLRCYRCGKRLTYDNATGDINGWRCWDKYQGRAPLACDDRRPTGDQRLLANPN